MFQSIAASVDCDSLGDLNEDQQIYVLDIVLIINIILYESNPSGDDFCTADINQDNTINILDVVGLINWILD